MTPRLRILGGGRAGDEVELGEDRVLVGRTPEAHLRLDPDRDLAVSKRHAELRKESGGWTVRDLGSRNGTFLNGVPVRGTRAVKPGDVIRLGSDGPEVRFEKSEGSVTARVRARTARATRRFRWTTGILVVLTVSALATASFLHRDRTEWELERERLRAAVDSLLQEEDRVTSELEGEVQALAAALERSRSQVEAIRSELDRRESADNVDPSDVAALRLELEEATQALARQQIAATLDFQRIEHANRSAVVLIFVENADGQIVSGTGFVVRDDALVVTARHILEGADGHASPRRVALQFSDSEQVWPARVVATSSAADLALLQAMNIRGPVPTIQGINTRPDTVQSGSPVAALGFPLGGSLTPAEVADGRRAIVRPLLSAGVVLEVSPNHLEVQGFGEPGASGSPVLDANGEVLAVVYEGRRGPRGGVLRAAPADRVQDLIRGSSASGAPRR